MSDSNSACLPLLFNVIYISFEYRAWFFRLMVKRMVLCVSEMTCKMFGN